MFKKCMTIRTIAVLLMLAVLFWNVSVMATPLTKQQITVLHPDEEKAFVIGKDLFKFRQFSDGSGQDLQATEITLAANYGGFLLKKHSLNADETLYGIEGKVECVSNQMNKVIQLKAGDVAQIPAGVPYGCKGAGSESSRLLVVSPSHAFGNFIAEIGTPASQSPQATSEPDIAKVIAAAQKFGIEFLN